MPPTSTDWNKTSASKTLDKLGKDYPGYTTNELYVIWCVNNELIPLDDRGKLDVDKWQRQAREDGRHAQDGGFRVARAIYGRAQKAKKDVGKPKGKPRGRGARAATVTSGAAREAGLSRSAVAFARKYDQAGQAIEQVQQKRKEIAELLEELKGTSKAIAQDLAEADEGAREILHEAGLL